MALACSCLSCGSVSRHTGIKALLLLPLYCVLRFIARAIFAALTVLFLMGGAFAGGVAGALAGWISNGGIIHGVTVVAVAGASISLELLEAMRAYWCSEYPRLYVSSSMADFLQQLLHGRFVNEQMEQLQIATSRTYDSQSYGNFIQNLLLSSKTLCCNKQLNRSATNHSENSRPPAEVSSAGLSRDSLNKLPWHVLSYQTKAAQDTCCTICLQDIGVGNIARCLPKCNHTFHRNCVDKWLVIHNSCPVCRHRV
ncbi:OLC1v1012459C1 [Oldenlandia corymbosa var. corymbosa]|uniref:OLC1v1012459C1 n=1 Tax=Oldenlandia corymbosa var. corymbosa TaxID=529605 RepID=A0AAV1DY62_OLDCO|nr:OLC1v1012459C1 [Oldenlandia corymbosa var. corymbosa]